MKKYLLILTCMSLLAVPLIFAAPGNHNGEQKQLAVDIQFLEPSGQTITNAQGIFYYCLGGVGFENKVYPSQYWDTFPLYFFGDKVHVTVTVTNLGPRQKTKVRIISEAYVLLTSGLTGASLAAPNVIEVEVAQGETRSIDASFTTVYTPDADSGLDRFIVKVLHVNEGGGPGNPEPALIMSKEGVFCPPKYVPQK